MATQQATDFGKYAGQLIADGVRPDGPTIALETAASSPGALAKLNGLARKFSDVLIFDTRVFSSPLDKIFKKIDERFGSGIEMAVFKEGATNKKNPMNTCFPKGNVAMLDQYAIKNYAYDIDISIGDREVNGALMNQAQLTRYMAEKMKTPLKTEAIMRHRSEIQLISDFVAGTRSIVSTDGNGTAVTYSVTTDGFAGKVVDESIYIPAVEVGTLVTFPTAADALNLALDIEGLIADMYGESTGFTALQNATMLMEKPNLIMETKVLNAMDAIFAVNGGYKGFPTVDARTWLGKLADIVEIDSFASLPTAVSTADKRPGALIIDKDATKEFVYEQSVESQRCAKQRATGYSFQGESAFTLFKGVPSCGITFSTAAPQDGGA